MSELPSLKRATTLSEQAAHHIRSLITSGQWPIGGRIPPEHELVDRLGVSRNTVREALRALVHTGLLEARVGDGTYVKAASELRAAFLRRSEASTADEVLALRLLLEEYAAGQAALRATADDVSRLENLLDATKEAARGPAGEYAAADIAFHREVVVLSGNSLLVDVYDHLGASLTDLLTSLMAAEPTADDHDRLHRELLGAIAEGDEVGARHAASMLVAVVRAVHDDMVRGPGRS